VARGLIIEGEAAAATWAERTPRAAPRDSCAPGRGGVNLGPARGEGLGRIWTIMRARVGCGNVGSVHPGKGTGQSLDLVGRRRRTDAGNATTHGFGCHRPAQSVPTRVLTHTDARAHVCVVFCVSLGGWGFCHFCNPQTREKENPVSRPGFIVIPLSRSILQQNQLCTP
jgi:hypothetical protein